MRKTSVLFCCALAILTLMGADDDCNGPSKSDQQQTSQQEKLLLDANSQIGMPAIKNFREKKLLKDILELRDQDGLVTYTYTFSEMTGKLTKFCDSAGYGIPYATQFTNPQKPLYSEHYESPVIGQADPNGLFSPASAEGTWVMCSDPVRKGEARPVYIEPRVVVSPFPLQQAN